ARERDWGKGSADNIRANGRHDPHQQAGCGGWITITSCSHLRSGCMGVTGLVMSGRRPLIKDYFAVVR
ncbi:MAG: hypothetical protein WA231_11220, partial [Methylocella sp.]